jgi:predicted peptidase
VKANQTPQQFEIKTDRALRVQYLLFLPAGYQPEGKRLWPLILFLHGSGERGAQVSKVARHGPPKLVQKQPDFPFLVVSPQCPAGQYWSNEILLPLLDQVMQQQRVDPGRVYLTGLSMGGYGAWNLATAAPARFAAVVPICGGGDVLPVLLAEKGPLEAIRSLPVWAFHGAKDPVVPLEESQRMVAAFRRVGNEAKLTVYSDAGHDSWTETYRNPDLYEWLLEKQRPKASRPSRL